MPALYDQIFLFGDSITQDSYNQQRGPGGFSAQLQHEYIRRLDVVNRGFSGYNTEQALKVLPTIIPTPDVARIRLLVVFFGANDASLPQAENNQHVPLSNYKNNLEKIVTHPLVMAHNPKIILVAPPPINEHLQWISDRNKGLKSVARTAANTKGYAEAVVGVGQKLGVPVVNLWETFMRQTEFNAETWKEGEPIPGAMEVVQNDALVKLMYDGLHLEPSGYQILFEEVLKIIAEKWPSLRAINLPPVLPLWNDPAGWEAWSAVNTKG